MATATIPLKGSASMESKKVSISSKRQITIPQKFFTLLGFNTEAECIMRGNELVLRPVKENTSGEFAEQILADLIRQGYSGEELLEKFKQTQRKIRPAVEAMLAEADRVAESKSGGYSLEDVFGTEDEKMTQVQILPPAAKFLKKLKDKKLKSLYKEAIEMICEDYSIGEEKTGDLAGMYGYDIYYNKTNYELAYRVRQLDDLIIIVIMAGTRENFYEELKRYIRTI